MELWQFMAIFTGLNLNKMPKIVVIGTESTGKTTLAKGLSDYFEVPFHPEFARVYLEKFGPNYTFEDVLTMAKGQLQIEENNTDTLQILDTNLYVYKVWLQEKYNQEVDWIEESLKNKKYDYYFLCDIDLPWQPDPIREHPNINDRIRLLEKYHQLLLKDGTPFSVVSGNIEERLEFSIQLIQKLIKIN